MFRTAIDAPSIPEVPFMQIDYTGRQMDITPAIKTYTEQHLSKLGRILGDPFKAHVILTVEKHRHVAEITVKARLLSFVGIHETTDMYSSLLGAVEKIETQAKKYKAKRNGNKRRSASLSHVTMNIVDRESRIRGGDGVRVIRSRRFAVKPMSVEEAVQEVRESNSEFLVFRNAESDSVNVIYRRSDGHFGLIEPEA